VLGDLGLGLSGPLLRTSLPVEDIGSGHFVLPRAHQRQLDLVLDVFNVNGAASRHTTNQGADHLLCQRFGDLANPGAGCTLAPLDCQEGLGQGNVDLGRFKKDHCTISTNHFEILRATGGRSAGSGTSQG